MNEFGFEWLNMPKVSDVFEIVPLCKDFVCDKGDFTCTDPKGFKGCKSAISFRCNGNQIKDR
jgi:hypothetical protein